MVELIKLKRKRNINILLERPISDEIFDYLHDFQLEGSHLDAQQWWCKIGSEKYPRLTILAKGFLSICASSSPSERFFLIRTRDRYIQKGKISIFTKVILIYINYIILEVYHNCKLFKFLNYKKNSFFFHRQILKVSNSQGISLLRDGI